MAMNKIACCTDFSENAEYAFETALDIAEKFGARLYVIHVLPQPVNPLITDIDNPIYANVRMDESEENRKALILKVEDQMEENYGIRIGSRVDYEFVILDGHVSTEIINCLEDRGIDLAVMGAYGLSGMGLVLFGSIAKRVAHKAKCSVMIARNHDKE